MKIDLKLLKTQKLALILLARNEKRQSKIEMLESIVDLLSNLQDEKEMHEYMFPNGFEDWHETHYEVISFIEHSLSLENGNKFCELDALYGRGELYNVAKNITNDFEKKNKGRNWDGEFYDEICDFCENWHWNYKEK